MLLVTAFSLLSSVWQLLHLSLLTHFFKHYVCGWHYLFRYQLLPILLHEVNICDFLALIS